MNARTLLATWSIAAPLYLMALLLLARDFLPLADEVVYDCRWMACNNQDKLDEFASSQGRELGSLARLVQVHVRGEPYPDHEINFNPAPVLLVTAVGRVAPPVLAYNLTLFLAWLGAGLAMATLVLGLTRAPAAGIVAGWLYLLAPMTLEIQHCRSLDYGLLLLLPLTTGLAVRAGGKGRWPSAAGLAVALVLLWSTNQYLALGMTCLCAVWTAAVSLTRIGGEEAGARRRGGVRVAAALGISLVLVAPWLWIESAALGARRHDLATYGVGLFAPGQVAAQLGGWLDPRHVWSVPVLALALTGAAIPVRGLRPVARGLGALSLAGITACGLLVLLYEPVVDALRVSSVAWRMREIHMLAVIPATLIVALAGIGWAGVMARIRSAALVTGALLATALLCASILVAATGWWPGVRAGGISLQIPEPVIDAVEAIEPDPTLFVFTPSEDEDVAMALHVIVAQRTPVERPRPSVDRHVQAQFEGEAYGEAYGEAPLPAEGIPDELSSRCLAALIRATGEPRDEALRTLAGLGLSEVIFEDGAWALVHNARCGTRAAESHGTGPSSAP